MNFLPVGFNRNWGRDFFSDFDDFFKPRGREERRHQLLRTDISELDDSYVLEMEVPGVDKKNISIELENGYLSVSAKISEERTEKDDATRYIKKERREGEAKRTFYVGDIEENKLIASCENGILKITIPKKEEEKPQKKQIEVK